MSDSNMNTKKLLNLALYAIPIVGFARYLEKGGAEDDTSRGVSTGIQFAKVVGHAMYAVIVPIYGSLCILTGGTWTPAQWARFHAQAVQERQDYDKARQKIFGYQGLADRDKSSGINFDEKVDAWRRMGYTNEVFIEGEGTFPKQPSFPKPTLSDLERALQSYEAEQKKSWKQ